MALLATNQSSDFTEVLYTALDQLVYIFWKTGEKSIDEQMTNKVPTLVLAKQNS